MSLRNRLRTAVGAGVATVARASSRAVLFRVALLIAALLLPSALFAVDQIVLNKPIMYPEDKQTLEQVEAIARRAAAVANRLYGEYIDVYVSGDAARNEYSLDIMPISTPPYSALTVTLKRTRDQSTANPEALYGRLDGAMANVLAAVIFFQWSSFQGYLAEMYQDPPILVDELPSDAVGRAVLPPGAPATLMPSSTAVKRNGNVIVGMMSLAVEFDPDFRIVGQPGKSLLDGGNYSAAYGVSVTPANTVYLKPSTGREVYRIIEGSPRPQRVRVTIDATGGFTALADGSFVLADWQKKKAYRFDGRHQQELDLFSGEYSYLSAMAVGPEGNLWVYDSNVRSVRIYSPYGDFLDVVVPLVDPAAAGSPYSLSVYADGSFILFSSMGHLMRFRRNGVPVWKLEADFLPQMASVGTDSERGLIHMTDYMGKRVLKLMDASYRREHGIEGGLVQEIAALNRTQSENWDDPAPTLEKARLYEQAGAFEMARYLYETILDVDPFNAAVAENLDRIDVAILKLNAQDSQAKTLELLATLGPASARQSYDAAMRIYESILSLNPAEEGIQAAIDELNQAFGAASSEERAKKLPLKIVELKLENVFPSLLQHYRTNPVGHVVVSNPLAEEIKGLRAQIFIKRYMDYPSESDGIASLAPEEETRLELPILLNTQVFELQEDLPVQVEVRLIYEADGSEQIQTKNAAITIHRRTALAWDDSGKISTFIMPNESTVNGFSHRVSDLGSEVEQYEISRKLFRAMRICDSLGVYGIAYVEDPDSPISKILGSEQVIDTVRFPRTTLLIRSGDCDDSTALLGSLLESVGISTAVMTSPGHVFLAFDSGEPAENAWMLGTADYEIIEHNDSVWIPVETTILDQGFFAAWRVASDLVKTHRSAAELEFLPVADQRAKYPALPLPESTFTIVEPPAADIDALHDDSLASLRAELYESVLANLMRQLGSKSGSRARKLENKIGILHARFGIRSRAEESFLGAIAADAKFIPSYVNLANLYLSQGDTDEAVAVLQKAFEAKPRSALVNLLMAQCYHRLGNSAKVREHYTQLAEISSPLAERYSYLDQSAAGTARASDAAAQIPLIWDIEEEE